MGAAPGTRGIPRRGLALRGHHRVLHPTPKDAAPDGDREDPS